MSDYILTSNGIVPVNDETLMHWKYIKRVKQNGKWKYYYDWDQLKDDMDLGIGERKAAKVAAANYKMTLDKQQHDKQVDGKTINGIPVNFSEEHKANVSKRKVAAEKEYDKKIAEYLDTPLGKAETSVQNTKQKISDSIKEVKDKAGVDEREKLKKASAEKGKSVDKLVKTSNTVSYYKNSYNSTSEQRTEAGKKQMTALDDYNSKDREYDKALDEYLNTPLGKLENTLFYIEGERFFRKYMKKR